MLKILGMKRLLGMKGIPQDDELPGLMAVAKFDEWPTEMPCLLCRLHIGSPFAIRY